MSLLEVVVPGFILDYNIIWPSILITCSLYYMLKRRRPEASHLIVLFIGIWFLLVNINLISGTLYDMFWPILLIVIGLALMINTSRWLSKIRKEVFVSKKDGYLNFHGVFGGAKEKVKSKDFIGANIHSVFGGCEIDFNAIEFQKDSAIINIYSVFGGTQIWVPKDVNLIINSTGIFGGNDNKTGNETKKGQKTLYINAISVFGGCEIKN